MTVVGVFGAGRIGSIHAGNLHANPDAVVRYVVDVDEQAASRLASNCGARVVSATEALDDKDITAVVIATSTDTHTDLIKLAAAAGKAIFCEKPIDLDIDTAREGIDAVEQHGVHLSVGFNRRHDPSFHKLKDEIDAGTVGSVEHVSITSRDPSPPPADYVARSGGIFRDMMIHDFDMARWLFGEEPVKVFASGSVLIDESIGKAGDIDSAVAVLKTASGKLCRRKHQWCHHFWCEYRGELGIQNNIRFYFRNCTCSKRCAHPHPAQRFCANTDYPCNGNLGAGFYPYLAGLGF